ncbi:alcohol oxidase [Mycena polygramma]|nr:alcohol oxidase [Mycena polygramma]
MVWLSTIVCIVFATTVSLAAVFENVANLNQLNLQFDFIVVGGGTAGNVVANRLSENPRFSVLVLEAGGSNANVLNIIVPFYSSRAEGDNPQDWNYTTTPQAGLNGRSISYPRGFVLGGSSSVNSMVYTRGSKEDFDRWAEVTGDDGWSWDNLIPYMRKNERFTPPSDHHNTTGQFDPAVHGFHGINAVSLQGFPSPITTPIFEATKQLEGYPFNLDMNSGYHLGIGWGQWTVNNGSRSMTRVLPTTSNTFRTVELAQDINGKSFPVAWKRFTITAKKEVIMSAGSIGTPNILLHSGIGNSSRLRSLGIRPEHNLPSVGQNLTDHPLTSLSFLVNSNNTYETVERNTTLAAEQFAQWNTSRTGPLVDPTGGPKGWLRVLSNSSIFEKFPDLSAGPNTAHYELLFSNGLAGGVAPPTGNFIGIRGAVLCPMSRGSVTLNSTDPFADPVINPNILDSEFDLFIARKALKSGLRFASAPAWDNYVISPVGVNSTSSEAEMDDFIRKNTGLLDHPVGTASMSPKGATWGVVDPDLIVKGLRGIRIVDISIAPFIPAAHTQAATYFVAERASDLIKEAWSR